MHVTGLMPALYDTSLIDEYKRKGKGSFLPNVNVNAESTLQWRQKYNSHWK